MWESPSWIGSLITSKVKKESDAAARNLTSEIEANKIASQQSIAELNAQTNRAVTEMNVQMNRDVNAANVAKDLEIAKNRLETDKEIAEARNKVNREIAMWQVIGNVAPKVLPIVLGAKVVGKSNSNNDSNKNNSGSGANLGATSTVTTAKSQAQKKADSLFPELEPTFTITPLDRTKVPGNSKVTKIGINTAMVSAAIAALSSLPILGL